MEKVDDLVLDPVDTVDVIDQDEPPVTRLELWSYYLFWNGDASTGPFGYSFILFQGYATKAGYDPVRGPGSSCLDANASGNCVLPWLHGTKSVNSIILIANGLSFLFMSLIFTTLSPAADYGNIGKWALAGTTIVCLAAQFSFMSVTGPNDWRLAMGLYMVSFITCASTFAFLAATVVRLARNTEPAINARRDLLDGHISSDEYAKVVSFEKSRISSISWVNCNFGYFATLCLALSILLPLADNPKADNYTLLVVNSWWIVLGIWWFIFQQYRPGPPFPKGRHYLTLGWVQVWHAVKQYRRLPHTFLYLIGYFLLADAFNTTNTLVSICQNAVFEFSFLQITYLSFVQSVTSFSRHKRWKLHTKKLFLISCVATVFLTVWGMIGIWTHRFGLRKVWEFWAYSAYSGLLQASYYSFSQTMMSELSPRNYEYLLFGLFSLTNRSSSVIGPNVIQAIIDRSNGNNWMGYPFLFALSVIATIVICFVDLDQGRKDATGFHESQQSLHSVDKVA
ncbi:hypothetical protein DL93DRAFT_2163290 [Clavulina sp. PMI_390]|nr:hypothetical protein DL93DRAFT_2163290 [Clavulina sp. PMI_390]